MTAVDILTRYAVTKMDTSHLDQVIALERTSSPNPWTLESFTHEIESNVFSRPRVAVTLDSPPLVVGFCVAWVVYEEMHIQNIAVDPQHRGLGLGRHLLQRAIDEGARGGATTANLEVRRGNTAALTLYESLGFVVTGERTGYYSRPREDAVVLLKELS